MITDSSFDVEWVIDYCKRTGQAVPDGVESPPKRSKYGNKKTVVDGIKFDSKREADRWAELTTLLRAGKIYGVFRQHPFRLPGGVVYRADFVVLNPDGTYTVEDAKGMKTKEYLIKRKQMRECLGIEIHEV